MSFRQDVKALQGESLELRRVLAQLNQDADPRGTTFYVDAVDGKAGNDGLSWDRPLLTMAGAFDKLTSGDTIRFRGKIVEQLTTPAQVFDVTVIGDANRPRHADATPADVSGKSHGASWQPPASPTADTPLVKVQNQGWAFVNILFDSHTDAPAVELFSDAGSGNDERDGSHASFIGCRFVGPGESGIASNGGQTNVLIEDCDFQSLTSAVTCVSTSVRICQFWTVRNSRFRQNTNGITASLTSSVISGSHFDPDHTEKIDTQFNSGQGGNNLVGPGNFLGGTYSNAGGYTDATGDEWAGNFNEAGITAANPA